MPAPFTLCAQLHSFPPTIDALGVDAAVEKTRRAVDAAGIEILIAGGTEIPALYHRLTAPGHPAAQVFLWFPVLADYPGFQAAHRVIGLDGVPSRGWGSTETWQEAGETFQFACPNRPEVAETVLAELERQLRQYPFDGVFLDKIRFPSPANGLDDLLSCFCPFCQAAAAREDLDLGAVRARLRFFREGRESRPAPFTPGGDWLDELLAGEELLLRFLHFRAHTITALAARLAERARGMGRETALDLFSPSLGRLVGQDYTALAPLAAWIKPMSYRYAAGPAGLRLEVPALMQEMADFLGIPLAQVEAWAARRIPGLATAGEGSLSVRISRDGAPTALLAAETGRAVRLSGSTPVYLGVEAVSIPAFQIHTTPQQVSEALAIARGYGAAGAVLSWDVLAMPLDNLRAARNVADG